jgi:hypothetical protein
MADQDKLNSEGREANAARPLTDEQPAQNPQRYPPTGQDDAVETGEAVRTFDAGENPQPRQGAGDSAPPKR